jgi:transcriptional regulator with XRE-family HTH domain
MPLVPRLKAIRESKVISQEELALSSEVNVTTISRLENGQVARITTIRKLAKALGVNPTELVRPAD